MSQCLKIRSFGVPFKMNLYLANNMRYLIFERQLHVHFCTAAYKLHSCLWAVGMIIDHAFVNKKIEVKCVKMADLCKIYITDLFEQLDD